MTAWNIAARSAEMLGTTARLLPAALLKKIACRPRHKYRIERLTPLIFIFFNAALKEIDYDLPVERLEFTMGSEVIHFTMALNLRYYIDRRYFFADEDTLVGSFLRQHLSSRDVYFDLGASIGHTTLIAATTGARVYAFEPETRAFQRLRANIARNQRKNVICYNVAVSNQTGTKQLNISTNNEGSHSLENDFVNTMGNFYRDTVTINAKRLDDLSLPQPSVVKIDVEGHEFAALSGMTSYLPRTHYLICETTPARLAKLRQWLAKHNLTRCYLVDKTAKKFVLVDEKTVPPDKRLLDVLFVNNSIKQI